MSWSGGTFLAMPNNARKSDPELNPGIRIVSLNIEGFKRISAASISPPESGVVVISGKNDVGKTSLLDAMTTALGGGSETKKVKQPIRKGDQKSVVVVDLGDYVVTRVWEHDRTYLTVKDGSGRVRSKPQHLLDGLLGRLSFDPTQFMKRPAGEQRDMLLQAVGLGDQINQIDAARKLAYDERTIVGREGERVAAQLKALPEPEPGLPGEEVSATELLTEIRKLENRNRSILDARSRRTKVAARITELRNELELLEFQLAEMDSTAEGDLVDTSSMEAQMQRADSLNSQVRQASHWHALNTQYGERLAQYKALTKDIADLDAQKDEALRCADLPVVGLGVDNEGITYNGVPFADANTASQLRTAVAIAMSLNPTIRIVRLTDGSLLDAENMAALNEMAQHRGFQVWVERVDDSGGTGIVIEDGAVVSNSYVSAAS